MSIFGNSMGIQVLLPKLGVFGKFFFLDEGATRLLCGLGVLGGQVPRLYYGTIFGQVQHTKGDPAGH